MAFYVFVLEMLVYGVGCIASETLDVYFISFQWSGVLGLLFLALSFGVHFHLIYVLGNDKTGALMLLITSILMVLCTGLVIPFAYLPGLAQLVGEMAPLYGWSLLAQESLFGEVGSTVIGLPLVWMMVELAMGVYFSWKKA